MRLFLCIFVAALWSVGCKGDLAVTDENTPPGVNNITVNPDVSGVATVGVRRLTRAEYSLTVESLLGDTTQPGDALPEDNVDPFENHWRGQTVSLAMVIGAENAATGVAQRFVEDPNRIPAIAGCTPSGPTDEACFRTFIETFGLRAFRRPLDDSEVDAFMRFHAFSVEDNNFATGVMLAIQAFLQMPDFLYVLERGVAVPGRENIFRLTQYEIASRLSYFLWGTNPDDELLEAAANDQLATSEQMRAQAERMLNDPKARARIQRFHAMWLGYHRFGTGNPIADAMVQETERLIERVVFEEERDFFDLFTINESYMSPELAEYYGFTAPASADWISYADSGRGGILSHGTFLSVASKFGDTSPTQRGRLIRERLMCTPIDPPPPDLNVNVDEPPEAANGSTCKQDRYMAVVETPGCGFCHSQTDLIGLGLEKFDQAGLTRTTDVDDPTCTIEGNGELVGVGTFSGPKQLGELLVQTDQFQACLVRQVYQFAFGTELDPADREVMENVNTVRDQFNENGHNFKTLLLDIVSSEMFQYRVLPEATL